MRIGQTGNMLIRTLMCLILIGVGAFAVYTVWTKPNHPFSEEPLDQALGVPGLVTRILRGAIGLLSIGLGVIGMLRAFGLLSE